MEDLADDVEIASSSASGTLRRGVPLGAGAVLDAWFGMGASGTLAATAAGGCMEYRREGCGSPKSNGDLRMEDFRGMMSVT